MVRKVKLNPAGYTTRPVPERKPLVKRKQKKKPVVRTPGQEKKGKAIS